jgi:hypothetical protein
MKKAVCKICGKVVEGFSDKDLAYRMIMHMQKHRGETAEVVTE